MRGPPLPSGGGGGHVPRSRSAPLCNVTPRPGCDLPQTLRKLLLFLPCCLLLKYQRKGEASPPVLTSRGGGKRRQGGSPACPRCLRCPLFALPTRRAAGSATRVSAAAAPGRGEAAEQIFQQRDSAAALPVEQTPSQPHALLPCNKEGQAPALPAPCLASGCGELSLPGTPADPGRSPRWKRSAVRLSGSARSSGCLLRPAIKKPLSSPYDFFPPLLLFFLPPVTVCGKWETIGGRRFLERAAVCALARPYGENYPSSSDFRWIAASNSPDLAGVGRGGHFRFPAAAPLAA